MVSAEEIGQCVREIMEGDASTGQMGAFLIGLHFNRTFQYTPEVIFASAETMLSFSVPISVSRSQ